MVSPVNIYLCIFSTVEQNVLWPYRTGEKSRIIQKKKKIINLCDTYRVQVESWCGGGLIHIHPLPSVLLGGVSWPLRGSARQCGTHLVEGSAVPAGYRAEFKSISVCSGGAFQDWLLLGRMSGIPVKAVEECNRSCQGATRKVHSPSALMSKAHKQTHHLHCLGTWKLISMCIKHKVAGRCTNGMLSLHPRWCYYVHIIPYLADIFNVQYSVNLLT